MGLEKLVELEFQCPCNPKWNGLFSSAFFIIPAIMAFILMLIIQGCRWDEWFKKTVSSSVPAIVWLISLFLDGQYFACAMTDWEGRFVLVDKAAPQKWCKPISEGNFTTQELMLRSQEWIFKSQVIAILLLIFICMGLTVYLIRNSCQEKKQTDSTREMQLSEVS
ncbi:calcium homeostasis modulator protein 6-like isoform X2 [Takifugu rubripes]|nr:calcium homeostasis modulator protein 6-like isoform X2 [Takifugu rubripes]XP_029702588.1 calcium homeostasis modulator protein 6-like isoform X2 [Takifugu rubripes]XP_029702591.1 calcium homeostasis modulator protein 6-like isoform X2 [Takifugu rubripes]